MISFQPYGCRFIPALGEDLGSDDLCGGAVKMRVELTTLTGTLRAVLTVFCIVGPRAPASHNRNANPPFARSSKRGDGSENVSALHPLTGVTTPNRSLAGRVERARMDVASAHARRWLPAWHPVDDGRRRGTGMTAGTGGEGDLVARARDGDRDAFEQLVVRHADRLFAVVLRACASRDEAEEVVQETFLRAWRSLDRFEGRSQFFTWLYRIGVNEARRSAERRRARPRSAPLADAADEIPDESDAPHAILALPLDYQMPLVLRDVEGLSTAEAAAVMELGEAAFKSRLHRARMAVRAAVEDYALQEDDG